MCFKPGDEEDRKVSYEEIIPDYLEQMRRDVINAITPYVGQPPTPYEGPLYAPIDPMSEMAANIMMGLGGQGPYQQPEWGYYDESFGVRAGVPAPSVPTSTAEADVGNRMAIPGVPDANANTNESADSSPWRIIPIVKPTVEPQPGPSPQLEPGPGPGPGPPGPAGPADVDTAGPAPDIRPDISPNLTPIISPALRPRVTPNVQAELSPQPYDVRPPGGPNVNVEGVDFDTDGGTTGGGGTTGSGAQARVQTRARVGIR